MSSPEYDVFISHKHEDNALARAAQSALQAWGVRCYLDEADSGIAARRKDPKALVEHIEKMLGGSLTLLVTYSDLTDYSRWVPFEIGFVRSLGRALAVLDARTTRNQLAEYLEPWPLIRVADPHILKRDIYPALATEALKNDLKPLADSLKRFRRLDEVDEARLSERVAGVMPRSAVTATRESDRRNDMIRTAYRQAGRSIG